MLALTRSERRAALVVVALLLLGAAHDQWRARHPRSIATAAPGVIDRNVRHRTDPSDSTAVTSADSVANRTPAHGAVTAAGPIDLNRAGPEELDRLPGVGPVLAARIVEQRKRQGAFHEVDELLAVRGIGPRLLERLRPLVTVSVVTH